MRDVFVFGPEAGPFRIGSAVDAEGLPSEVGSRVHYLVRVPDEVAAAAVNVARAELSGTPDASVQEFIGAVTLGVVIGFSRLPIRKQA